MTAMTSSYDSSDPDYLDEEFFGPPPRFLTEETIDECCETKAGNIETHAGLFSLVEKLRSYLRPD